MRIILISFSQLPTMQKYLYLLSDELRKLGHEVLTIGSNDVQVQVSGSLDAAYISVPNTPKPSLGSIAGVGKAVKSVMNLIHGFSPEIVHFVNKHSWNYPIAYFLSKKQRRPYIIHTFHDPVGHEGDSIQKGVIFYHRAIMRLLDGIIVHSDIAEKQVYDTLKPACGVYQAPLGVTAWRKFSVSKSDKKNALVFGRINHYKGCEHYPSIFNHIYKMDPSVRITVAGKPSDDISSSLLHAIRSCPNIELRERFIDEGEMETLFCATRLVLAPYISITQSGVLLDAYSFSKPVVAFDIEGMRQYTACDDLLCTPFDAEGFARKTVELLSNEQMLIEHSRASWQYGLSHFTPEAMAMGVNASYESIMGA